MFEINADELVDLNHMICEKYQSPFGIREHNLLHSIPQGVNQTIFGEDAYPTLQDKVAFVVSSIAKNHIFIDANKRTAVLTYFALCKKYALPAKADNAMFTIVQKIATTSFDIEKAKALLF